MMHNFIKKYVFLSVFFICLLAEGHSPAAENPEDASWEKYKIITERNIFSRTRSPQTAIGIHGDAGGQEKSVEEVKNILYVLRGITIDNQSRRLFIENELTGQSFQLGIGEEFDGVIVKEIQSSYAVIRVGKEDVQVKIGSDLAGRKASAESVHTPSSPNTTTNIKESEFRSNEKEDDTLRQLIERRKREMGGEN
jgi:hypothetical protein